MINFEQFVMSFVKCEVPEEAMIHKVIINSGKKIITLEGTTVDTHGNMISEVWDIPFVTTEDLFDKEENDAEHEIID